MSVKPIKPFLTYSQQINNLVSNKRMVIHDFSYAVSKLEDISLPYAGAGKKEFMQYLKVLTHFRNVCTHNERLFYKRSFDIPDTLLHKKLGISKRGNQYQNGKFLWNALYREYWVHGIA